jgi:hypothetical protein
MPGMESGLTVRIVTARIMLASMMKIAPPKSSINVNLRRSVAVTPHSSYLLLVKIKSVVQGNLTGSGIDSKYKSVMMLRTRVTST